MKYMLCQPTLASNIIPFNGSLGDMHLGLLKKQRFADFLCVLPAQPLLQSHIGLLPV